MSVIHYLGPEIMADFSPVDLAAGSPWVTIAGACLNDRPICSSLPISINTSLSPLAALEAGEEHSPTDVSPPFAGEANADPETGDGIKEALTCRRWLWHQRRRRGCGCGERDKSHIREDASSDCLYKGLMRAVTVQKEGRDTTAHDGVRYACRLGWDRAS